jgi:hypothetical protein
MPTEKNISDGDNEKTSVVCLPPLTSVRDPAGLNSIHEKLCIKTEVKDLFHGVHVNFFCRSSALGSSFGEETTIKGNYLTLLLTTHVYGQQLFGSLIILNLQVLAIPTFCLSWNLLKPEVISKIKCGEF